MTANTAMEAPFLASALAWIGTHAGWAYLFLFVASLCESLAIVGIFVPGIAIMLGAGALVGPLLMLSSAGRMVTAPELNELGIAACLTKPASQSDLLEAVRGLLLTGQPKVDRDGGHIAQGTRPLKVLLAEDTDRGGLDERFTAGRRGRRIDHA